MRWSGITEDACSSSGCCIKSCDLLVAFTPCNTWSSGGPAHERGGATDLPYLSPLSVAGYGRLQLDVPHWAASVEFIIDPTFCGSRFSPGRLLAIEDFCSIIIIFIIISCLLH